MERVNAPGGGTLDEPREDAAAVAVRRGGPASAGATRGGRGLSGYEGEPLQACVDNAGWTRGAWWPPMDRVADDEVGLRRLSHTRD